MGERSERGYEVVALVPETARKLWVDGLGFQEYETDEVEDWDDDGANDDGAPIMRPIYRRVAVRVG